ncbi:MAG TPA: hypothetical protein VKB23_06845 [Solirubrobacterales bacterium]|nr:hypothetical protein [Solirubrobacterales bacterium]
MSKKVTLLALTAVCTALFALPTAASANFLHVSSTGAFTISGGAFDWRTTSGLKISCTSIDGSGQFTTTTTGTFTLLYHGCKDSTFGLSCTSTGQPSGTVKTAGEFHLVTIETINAAGVLLTPLGPTEVTPGKRLDMEMSCFGVTTKFFGNGLVGTISHPACGGSSKTSGWVFKHSATSGHQQHTKVTGVSYDLETNAGGMHTTVSFESSFTITYTDGVARTLTCT